MISLCNSLAWFGVAMISARLPLFKGTVFLSSFSSVSAPTRNSFSAFALGVMVLLCSERTGLADSSSLLEGFPVTEGLSVFLDADRSEIDRDRVVRVPDISGNAMMRFFPVTFLRARLACRCYELVRPPPARTP